MVHHRLHPESSAIDRDDPDVRQPEAAGRPRVQGVRGLRGLLRHQHRNPICVRAVHAARDVLTPEVRQHWGMPTH